MTIRLTPYGSADQTGNLAKVGKKQTPRSLVARMTSADVAAKVGGQTNASPGLPPGRSPQLDRLRSYHMSTRLTPYGSAEHAANLAKVGKKHTPTSLAARMPSPEVAAKVGMQERASITSRRVARRAARV